MPCTTEDLSSIRCNDQTLTGESTQQNIWLQFLCLIAQNVDPAGGECAATDLLSDANTLVCAGGKARQKMIQAQVICDNLEVDCTQPVCYTPDQIEAMISILVCRIVNAIE